MQFCALCLIAFAVLPSLSRAQVPVLAISQEGSSVQFSVKASVALEGKFDTKDDPYITFHSDKIVQTGLAFDRKEYGMNSGIPFIKIADRVEVRVEVKVKRVSGPPLVFKE